MRKIAVLIIICLLFLCSCSINSDTYNNQETIGINYNNAINDCRFWLTTDDICYLEDNLIQSYFMVDKNSKTKIGTNGGYGDGTIQRYEDKIYMLHTSTNIDENNSEFELKCYDVNSKKTEKICSIKNCVNYLVLDGLIYYLECTWNEFITLELKSFSVNTEKHTKISGNIVSFGVIGDSLYYVSEENDKMVVYKYDGENEKSIKHGDFSIEGFSSKMTDTLTSTSSYTQKCIYFLQTDSECESTTIWKYSFDKNALSHMNVDGYIDEFVSYNDNSYFIISSESSESSVLYKLNNDTDEIIQIAEIQGSYDLFVGSDKGAYVLKQNDMSLVFYSNEGKPQVVYNF